MIEEPTHVNIRHLASSKICVLAIRQSPFLDIFRKLDAIFATLGRLDRHDPSSYLQLP